VGSELTLEQILAWADVYHATHGKWPKVTSRPGEDPVAGVPGESWQRINRALILGLRGLPGGSSLAKLLADRRAPEPRAAPQAVRKRGRPRKWQSTPEKVILVRQPRQPRRRSVTVAEILAWADAHRAATGMWPKVESGPVSAAPFDVTWRIVNVGLRKGLRGLPGGTTLRKLLAEHRSFKPRLTVEQILAWADAYHAARGTWPHANSRGVEAAPGENWYAIHQALRLGLRGLPKGRTLRDLLLEHRGPGASRRGPMLTVELVLSWADAYHATHGRWPTRTSEVVSEPLAEGLTWRNVDWSLRRGTRGLSGGSSLVRFLAQHRGRRDPKGLPRLTIKQILAWADAHHATHGRWPTTDSGPIAAAPGETWSAIQGALYAGCRGLPRKKLTLYRLLSGRKPPRPAKP
jgi:hypothetical protein